MQIDGETLISPFTAVDQCLNNFLDKYKAVLVLINLPFCLPAEYSSLIPDKLQN